ncbi:MAG: glycosyltransferase family 4 protein [Bacteroidia bacterium]
MKVLFASEKSVHLSNYCKAIRSYIDEIVLITELQFDLEEVNKSYVINFRNVNPFLIFKRINELRKIIFEEKPDVIHLHQINRLAFYVSLANYKTGIPIITTAWGSDVLLVPNRNFIFKMFTTYVLKRSKIVTADAYIMIDAMMKLVNQKEKYVHLQYGIDNVKPAEKQNIIYSNRLHRPLYNIEKIVKDFYKFSKTHNDWMLHIAGSDVETDTLKKLVNQYGINSKVKFLGWLGKEDNNHQYAISKIYVSIPSSDGTSVSLLEAMSADCIPVVSDLPVSHEWIKDGVNGVIRKADKNPFEEALKLNVEECFKINRDKINTGVSRTFTTKKFYELYQDLLTN